MTGLRRPTRAVRSRAALLALLGGLLAVPAVTGHAQDPASCPNRGQLTRVGQSWVGAKAPTFDTGPATMTAYAVVPQFPGTVYVTNGKVISRTSDYGCVWQEVLELTTSGGGDVGLSAATTTITSLTVPTTKSQATWVYATAVQVGEGSGRPIVLWTASGDIGSWANRSTGLPPVGRPTELAVAPTNASVAYLALRNVPGLPTGAPTLPGAPNPTQPAGALYRTSDGGSSWVRAADGTDFDGAPSVEDIAVSTSSPATLWTVAGGRLRVSTNSGATFSGPASLNEQAQASRGLTFTAVDVSRQRVVAFSSGSSGAKALVSTNGGQSFQQRTAPAGVTSTWHDDKATTLYIGTVKGGSAVAYRYDITGKAPVQVNPVASGVDFRPQTDAIEQNIHLLTPTTLYFTRFAPGRGADSPGRPPVRTPLGTVQLPFARLSPNNVELQLDFDETRTVDLALALPRSPTPVDMYFIVDQSGSMKALIDGVKSNLAKVVQSLVAQGIQVEVGLGAYKTVEDPPLYRRVVQIQRPGKAFYEGLEGLDADAGGQQEPVLAALYSAATGEGLDRITFPVASPCALLPTADTCSIRPNQDADWNAGSLRLFIHATDEKFINNLQNVDDSQEHSRDEVGAALRSRKIQHVGIAPRVESVVDLEDMGRRTGTLAPVSIDCDQDGEPDVKVGEPIVCGSSGRLDKMLVDVVNAVRDVQPLRVVTAPSPVLKRVAPSAFPAVNVKLDNDLKFRLTVSCLGVGPGKYEINVDAELRNRSVLRQPGIVSVACGSAPAGVVANPPPPEAAPQQQQPAPQPPPANAPVPFPAVQIQPAPQPQPNPQLNPNAGAAAQEEEQLQVAVATNDVLREDREATEYAMAALSGVALMGAFGAGHALRRRSSGAGATAAAATWSRSRS
jgi:hypothetical protein